MTQLTNKADHMTQLTYKVYQAEMLKPINIFTVCLRLPGITVLITKTNKHDNRTLISQHCNSGSSKRVMLTDTAPQFPICDSSRKNRFFGHMRTV